MTSSKELSVSPDRPRVRARTMSFNEFAGRSVLVVDDEPMVREVVSAYLTRDGFEVTEAADGSAALEQLRRGHRDLVILDIMLPGADGLSVLDELRRLSDTPVILLSARGDESDRVLGLEMGADDYVVKPFSPRELAARARTVLRRLDPSHDEGERISFEGLVIDPRLRQVRVGDELAELTPKEFDLLVFLASSPGQVFSRGQILRHVWDSSPEWQDPATVTVHVRRLREKIEPDPKSPRRLVTVWGVGYRFDR